MRLTKSQRNWIEYMITEFDNQHETMNERIKLESKRGNGTLYEWRNLLDTRRNNWSDSHVIEFDDITKLLRDILQVGVYDLTQRDILTSLTVTIRKRIERNNCYTKEVLLKYKST